MGFGQQTGLESRSNSNAQSFFFQQRELQPSSSRKYGITLQTKLNFNDLFYQFIQKNSLYKNITVDVNNWA